MLLLICSKFNYRLKEIKQGAGTDSKEETSLLLQTINDSNRSVFEIFLEGKNLVTNTRVTADTREIQRRENEIKSRNARIDKFEDEATLAMEKFNKIANKWEEISKSNDPLELSEELMTQRRHCLDLIQQKEELINEFKAELKLADDRYIKDRSEMLEDIAVIARRIDEQVLIMKRSYLTELVNIEVNICYLLLSNY